MSRKVAVVGLAGLALLLLWNWGKGQCANPASSLYGGSLCGALGMPASVPLGAQGSPQVTSTISYMGVAA